MHFKSLIALLTLLLFSGCYEPERNCRDFRNGRFTFSSEINGETKTTTFVREGNREIDYFEGKSDTSEVRWINECEYIIKKLNPTNSAEKQSIQIKIIATSGNSYTFEYNKVGSTQKSRGTAYKTN